MELAVTMRGTSPELVDHDRRVRARSVLAALPGHRLELLGGVRHVGVDDLDIGARPYRQANQLVRHLKRPAGRHDQHLYLERDRGILGSVIPHDCPRMPVCAGQVALGYVLGVFPDQ